MNQNRKDPNRIRTKDWVACVICDTRRKFQNIWSHWNFEKHGKLPNCSHIIKPEDMCHRLKNPKDKLSEIMELESASDSDDGLNEPKLNSMNRKRRYDESVGPVGPIAKKRKLNEMDNNHNRNINDASDDNMQPIQRQRTIFECFDRIIEKQNTKIDMMTNETFLCDQIRQILDELKDKSDTLKLIDFTENEKNGYQSVFDSLFESKAMFGKTIVVMECVMDMMVHKVGDVMGNDELLIKYNFHGLRATEHEDCKENEVLIYCNICCKVPVYPKSGYGIIKSGRIIYKRLTRKQRKEEKYKRHWHTTKQVCKDHFVKDTQHWHNIHFGADGHTWDARCETALLHLIMLMVRMTKSFQADRQYQFNCAMLKRMEVIIGNIGHSIYYIAKLRGFVSNEIIAEYRERLNNVSEA
eukprot:443921_1